MTLPSNHPSPPSANIPVPVPLITPSALAMPDLDDPLHADYDLHPLLVRSLDHYVEEHGDGERFHVR
ncbi:hypothetical protein [Rhodanobacter sp. C01]|uniref:hypothetical protein n=1 Tax=Rhodanobacter sp. C01 TaxID=1945856 RepID=UPI000985088D|nr:hypothetical protein [Rhodanobacter sp. C01]OOG45746.1 hypothetical protein B0E50_16380 [Rhodanobacter sp. C01]